jgi:DNA-directed RNA polymerase subunit RPC12/RpoP
METTSTPHFVHAFDEYLTPAAYVCAGFVVLILLYHEFRIFLIKDYKQKYDYVNLHEIRYFWYAVCALILSVGLYVNSIAAHMSQTIFRSSETWFYVRTFLTVSFAVIAYFIFNSLVRIYYPRYVEKRLAKLRAKPRLSPSGNPMRKLQEHEEEAHLEASQFNEQNEVHSVDYDVWLDEKTGFKKIEKYNAYQHAIECPECGYVTFKITSEEIAKAPESDESGVLVKHYKCSYCNHREAKEVVVAALSENIA